ncbi:hypothetical protein GmHk_14G041332 [Glycine max]|nr:hypothetical protein GmHk_14G041332 [Glycine max]
MVPPPLRFQILGLVWYQFGSTIEYQSVVEQSSSYIVEYMEDNKGTHETCDVEEGSDEESQEHGEEECEKEMEEHINERDEETWDVEEGSDEI